MAKKKRTYPNLIKVKLVGGRVAQVDIRFIIFCFVMTGKEKVFIYTAGDKQPLVVSDTLDSLEEKLSPDRFYRTHRNTIVGRVYFRLLHCSEEGSMQMIDGHLAQVSREERPLFIKWIEQDNEVYYS